MKPGCALILCLSVLFATSSVGAFDIIASLFTDRTCSAVLAPPMGLYQGVCAYSEQYNFYYNISTAPSGQARFNFGCKQGCVGCAEVGAASYGSCQGFNLGGMTVYASAWRVDTSAILTATVYSDAQCTRQLPYAPITVQSGSCTYSQLLRSSFTAAQLDARDSPKSERIAYGLECNQQCGYCSTYGRTATDLCIPAFNVYTRIKSSAGNVVLAQ